MVFSFAVERTAKENCSAALLCNSLTLIHLFIVLPLRIAPNTLEGLILFAFRPLSGKQNKDKLCALCALSEAGGELLPKNQLDIAVIP